MSAGGVASGAAGAAGATGLRIRGFRALLDTTIPMAPQATLFTGGAATGKRSALEAIRIWAAQGDARAVYDVLERRGEHVPGTDEDDRERRAADCRLLFARAAPQGAPIEISEPGGAGMLRLHLYEDGPEAPPNSGWVNCIDGTGRLEALYFGLAVEAGGRRFRIPARGLARRAHPQPTSRAKRPRRRRSAPAPIPGPPCIFLEPGPPTEAEAGRGMAPGAEPAWDGLRLELMRLAEPGAERLEAATEYDDPDRELPGLRRLRIDADDPVDGAAPGADGRRGADEDGVMCTESAPPGHFGGAARRLLSLGAAVEAAAGGFLLADGIDDGLDDALLIDVWKRLAQAAEKRGARIAATTRRRACAEAFAEALNLEGGPDEAGAVVRLERTKHGIEAATVDALTLR